MRGGPCLENLGRHDQCAGHGGLTRDSSTRRVCRQGRRDYTVAGLGVSLHVCKEVQISQLRGSEWPSSCLHSRIISCGLIDEQTQSGLRRADPLFEDVFLVDP